MYDIGPYVSPFGFADSQRPFVWIRSRTSPSRSASAPGQFGREPSTGKWPYGDWPLTMRCAPIGPAYPTSITFECPQTFSPTLKPPRKTVAAASTQTGHSGREVGGGRSRMPIQTVRASR